MTEHAQLSVTGSKMGQRSPSSPRNGDLGTWTMALYAVPDIPFVQPGDDIAFLIIEAASQDGFAFRTGDVLVVAQKIVSKAENAIVRLAASSSRLLQTSTNL